MVNQTIVKLINFSFFIQFTAPLTLQQTSSAPNESALTPILIKAANASTNSLPSRRGVTTSSSNGRRDNKLMSVLQARRRSALSHNRWRSSEDCERQCRSSNNDEYCKLKCSRDMKLIRNGNNNNSNSNSNVNISLSEMSTSDSNLIAGTNGDEFLDTEESVHGLYFADPASKLVPSSGSKTKESSNLITNSNAKSMADQKRELKDKHEVTTTIRSIETTTVRRKTRPTVYRGRQKYVPVIVDKSVEESESIPYLVKIPTTSIRIPDSRNQIFNARRTPTSHTSLPPRAITRPKEEELEILEVSVPRQSSTEKNKFWKTRNAATLNSYMRRLNPHLHSSSGSTIITTKRPEPPSTTDTTTTIRYETIHRQRVNQTETPIAAINNLAEGPSDTKSVFLRSTSNASLLFPVNPFIPKLLMPVPENKNYYRPSGGLPSLIINIPEDATPYLDNNPIFDEPEYPSTEPTTETIEIDFTLISNNKPSSIIVPDNPEEASSERKEEKNFSKIPDINYIFKNVSTTTTPVTTVRDIIIPSSVSSSTTTSISKSTIPTTTEIFIPIKTTKRIYTTLPRRRPDRPTTASTPDQNGTTISSVLSNTSSKRNQIDQTTVKFVVSTTTRAFTRKPSTIIFTRPSTASTASTTSTTTKSSVIQNSPDDIEIVVPPSVTPENIIISSNRPDVILQGVSTTSKNQNTEVIVEMHKMNMATYVMAALGMVPLIVIVIYVIKQFIYRHERKEGDCEHYGNDIQPISPVVTLDHSDDGSIDGEDSIITETDFDRANLRFKSLLGEGNFGQVWKAEADDLAGHLGSTRIVAVKTERVNNGQGGLKAECEIMRKLGSHSNVVTLLGACVEQGEKF